MASIQDVVWRIQSDVSAAMKPLEGQVVAAPPRPFSAPSPASPREWGPRRFPTLVVYDEDQFHVQTRERPKEFFPSISVEDQGRLEVEQGLPDHFPDPAPPTPQTTITLSADNTVATYSNVTAGELVGLQLGANGASYAIGEDDGPDQVAAGLAAAAVAQGIDAVADGASLSVPGATPQFTQGVTYTATVSTLYHEHRVRARLRVDDKTLRKIVGDALEAVYPFNPDQTDLTMPDGSIAQVHDVAIAESSEFAQESETEIFIRDVTWTVLFSATQQVQYTTVVAVQASIESSYLTPDWWGPTPASLL